MEKVFQDKNQAECESLVKMSKFGRGLKFRVVPETVPCDWLAGESALGSLLVGHRHLRFPTPSETFISEKSFADKQNLSFFY